MSDMSFETENSIDVNGSVIDSGIITQGLNLLIIPEEQQELCLAFSIVLSIADVTRKTRYGRALVFSLENARKKAEQMISKYNAMLGDLTVIHAYQKGTFGNRIEEGLDVFLQDNSKIEVVVIDSLEKIIEAELGRMEYSYAHRKLCEIKDVADRHGASLIVGIHDGNPEGIGMLTEIADTVLKIVTKDENQNNHKYTFHVTRRDIPEKEIITEFDADNCTWKQIVDK